ncbi:response regulator transcription factor [Laceyella putida]|uniref:Response regulator transcription factor n=1 Tax=Laceyella putida TaxID=110101 RepID=A0ABW2RFD0_9BACL
MARNILIVDDDPDIIQLLTEALTYERFQVFSAANGRCALKAVERHPIDLIVMDIMMPEMDGLETIRKIRQRYHMPIILLSARDREIDKVIGLEIGADDYVAKPFGVQELVARIKAHFRRLERLAMFQSERDGGVDSPSTGLHMNEQTYEAFLNGDKLDLSTKEFQILHFLYQHHNQVLTREQIYQSVWDDNIGDLNTVTVHIKNIRKKLGEGSAMIKTIWGVGYKFLLSGEDR